MVTDFDYCLYRCINSIVSLKSSKKTLIPGNGILFEDILSSRYANRN